MDALEFPVTLPNQQKVEKLTHLLTITGAIVSLVAGIITSNLLVLVGAFGVSFVITALVVGPSWPMYKTNPDLKWLQVKF
ncbi:signal peptidase complex subunit 1 [Diutina catenulata]